MTTGRDLWSVNSLSNERALWICRGLDAVSNWYAFTAGILHFAQVSCSRWLDVAIAVSCRMAFSRLCYFKHALQVLSFVWCPPLQQKEVVNVMVWRSDHLAYFVRSNSLFRSCQRAAWICVALERLVSNWEDCAAAIFLPSTDFVVAGSCLATLLFQSCSSIFYSIAVSAAKRNGECDVAAQWPFGVFCFGLIPSREHSNLIYLCAAVDAVKQLGKLLLSHLFSSRRCCCIASLSHDFAALFMLSRSSLLFDASLCTIQNEWSWRRSSSCRVRSFVVSFVLSIFVLQQMLPQFPVPFLLFRWLLLYCKFFHECVALFMLSKFELLFDASLCTISTGGVSDGAVPFGVFWVALFRLFWLYFCYSVDPIRLAQCQDEVKSMQKCSLLCRRYNQFWQRRQQDVWIVVNNQAVYDLVFSYRCCNSGTDLAHLSTPRAHFAVRLCCRIFVSSRLTQFLLSCFTCSRLLYFIHAWQCRIEIRCRSVLQSEKC